YRRAVTPADSAELARQGIELAPREVLLTHLQRNGSRSDHAVRRVERSRDHLRQAAVRRRQLAISNEIQPEGDPVGARSHLANQTVERTRRGRIELHADP